ncbi:hypothetical protein [Sulfurospirillum cavolei]|uniref:hypothetical protein n=1 Tax=Sulfurospirillum cavolei TaxID=366522 RepID=UPI000764A282|nr:hypothetical protein [Sulfurospirillum cavolei]
MAHDFVNVTELLERIKDRLSKSIGERCVLDSDVAAALGIKKRILANAKYRNSNTKLLEPVLRYCMRERIDPIALLIKEKPNKKE